MSPIEFARFIQGEAAQSWAKRVDSLSNKTGIGAVIGNDGRLTFRVIDIELFRQTHERHGLTSDTIDHLVAVYASTNQEEIWQSFQDALDYSKQLCLTVLGDHHKELEEVPIVPIAESFLNAGAYPVPVGGHMITVNLGLAQAHYWVIALMNVAGLSRTLSAQDVEVLFDELPALSLMIVSGQNAVWNDPRLLKTFARFHRFFSGSTTLHDNEAFPLLFVMFHELGHIVLRHTDEIRNWPTIETIRLHRRLELLHQLRTFEFEADRFAVDHIAQLIRSREINYLGIAFLFGMLHLHERQTRSESQELRTHPSAVGRFERAIGRTVRRGDPPGLIEKMRAFMDMIDKMQIRS